MYHRSRSQYRVLTASVAVLSTFALTSAVGAADAERAQMQATATATATATPSSVAVTDQWYELQPLGGGRGNGFVIAPGKAELEVEPGDTVTYEVTVSNRMDDGRTFRLEFEDMAGTEDGSRAVRLLGDQYGPHTMRDFFSVPDTEFTLDENQRARLPITISVPENAEPGGYYGAVLVSTVQRDDVRGPGTGAASPVIARVGTLFFLTIPGEIERGGAVREFSLTEPQWWYERGPIGLSLLMENTGSVHLNPYAEVRITNMFGEEVGFLELEPWFVLPKSLRLREFTWDREWLLGHYTATANINLGYDDRIEEVSVSFWVLPWKVVGGIFIVVFLVLFIFRAFFRTFEIKRK